MPGSSVQIGRSGPKTFRFYMPLVPLREHYSDDGSAVLLQSPVRASDGRIFEAAVIGSSSDPLMIRISIFGLEEIPPPEDIPKIDAIAEVMLSFLRIYYNNGVSLAEGYLRFANLIDETSPPTFKISTINSKTGITLDHNLLHAALNAPDEFKHILKLVSDSMYQYLPLQYRYLSLFKVLEYAFKTTRRQWSPKLETLFSYFQQEYVELGVSKKSMKGLFIDLRDKCAHIMLGETDYLGIVGISSQDTEVVRKFMPLLLKVVQKYVFEKYRLEGTAIRSTDVW